MVTGFNTQQGQGNYYLQFETGNKEYFLFMQEMARRCVDGKIPTKELKHFLEVEIKRTREWQELVSDPIYDTVWVGFDEARTLRRNHIRFCECLLAMIDKEVSGE